MKHTSSMLEATMVLYQGMLDTFADLCLDDTITAHYRSELDAMFRRQLKVGWGGLLQDLQIHLDAKERGLPTYDHHGGRYASHHSQVAYI